ncbi:MAG: NAD(P)/FAD-dependent oxidoreductase [Bacillota bacterium]|nr:NAD(P)/FAD-dependent oxidoreductase [Bacillota bacterium]
MKLRVRNIRLPLEYKASDIKELAAKKLKVRMKDIASCRIQKKSIDARRKTVHFNTTVDVELNVDVCITPEVMELPEITLVEEINISQLVPGNRSMTFAPVIVGSGPAGLFCALRLAQAGYSPVVIERGQDVDRRMQQVDRFWREGTLNEKSNTQFGEGGAGTFSDGKLTTRIGDPRIDYVLETFVKYGADEEIQILKKPHVGTDVIRQVVKDIRKEIIRLGGEFYFDSCVTDLIVNKGVINSIIINNETEMPCSLLVLAVGNSARDVYKMLYRKNISLIPKAFAVGVRVEHPQELIDRIQYGDFAGRNRLPVADYHLTYQDRSTGRSLYTFCMCPGGYVIGAGSQAGQVVTNGMSYFKRDSGIANSALVVTVHPGDWDHEPLGGVKLQEELEHKAFLMGGENYHAPAQYMTDFLDYRPTESLEGSLATFAPGVTPANLWKLLPQEVAEVMRRGLLAWGKRVNGFVHEQAVLTGVETRTSAPLRIEREASMCSVNVEGLYPCGEGAGYAGGIVSAAVDGLKVAETIITQFKVPATRPEIRSDTITRGSDLR